MIQDQIEILQRALKREKSARKQAEKILENKSKELYLITEKLKESNSKLEAHFNEKSSELKGFIENLVDGYMLIDIGGNVVKMNKSAINLLGYNVDDEKLNIVNLVYQADYMYSVKSFKELFKKGTFSNYTAHIYTKEKKVRLVHINASVVYDNNNNPVGAQGIIRDITEEKLAQEHLIESENRMSTLITNLDSGVLLEDENRKIVLTNNKFCELFDISVEPSFLVGLDCSNAAEQNKVLFTNPDDFVARVNLIVERKVTVLGEELHMNNGVVLERDYIPIFNNKEYKGHLWSYKDVTLKRNYNQNLKKQKEKYSSIIANMNLGLVEVDIDNKIRLANQSFIDMTGYKEHELLNQNSLNFFDNNEDKEKLEKRIIERKKGKSDSFELQFYSKGGRKKYWLVSGAPNYDVKGNIDGSIGIILDITNIKKLELQKENLLKKLEQSNEELQEYAHIVSHDLKSPLKSIHALTSWLKEDYGSVIGAGGVKNIDMIHKTVERMETLINEILTYSSINKTQAPVKEVNTFEIINDIKKLLYIPSHISLIIDDNLPVIKADNTRIQQLFQNIISNAINYIDKDKGIVEVGFIDKKQSYIFTVKDNGVGIDKEYHKKIFNIFQSLGNHKDSTGIGLSIVKKIVDMYDGKIWLESQPKIGTTFYIEFKK